MTTWSPLGLVVLTAALGCSDATDLSLPPLASAPLTSDATRVPTHPIATPEDARNSAEPEVLAAMLAEGLGDEVDGPAETHTVIAPDGVSGAPGPNARLLVRFAHLADMQLLDDESPTRVAVLDDPGLFSAAFRPDESHVCHLVRATVRTLNAVHRTLPLGFVVLGGDNIDSAQSNELDWMFRLLDGGRVECDSGRDDDPIPGPLNDPKDALHSEGLAMPWYWVSGNHDVLVQGNLPVDAQRRTEAIGDSAILGTRFWDRPGAPVASDYTVADERRALLSPSELVSRVVADRDGHGLSAALAPRGEANYAFDVPGTRLRFVVVDTAAETGGAEGVVRQSDLDATIAPLLDAAESEGKIVIVVAHHALTAVSDAQGSIGTPPDDAISTDAWVDAITSRPNVLFALVAHSHSNRIDRVGSARTIFQIATSAVIDYPHQSRILEVWDDDNGTIRVRSTMVDVATTDDPLAEDGRRLGVLDYTSGWNGTDRTGTAADRNVELHIPAP